MTANAHSLDQLLEIMRRLRDPENGCAWDIKQNFQSIAPFTIEEAYEVADAIERDDMDDLQDELGDLLFQVVFHAQMAAELSAFTFDDVVQSIVDKMIRRHPHVFGDAVYQSEQEIKVAWESIKAHERAAREERRKQRKNAAQPTSDTSPEPPGRYTSVAGDSTTLADESPTMSKAHSALDGVALNLPALKRADKLQNRAARVGFDWPDINPVWDKLYEELTEVQEAVASGNSNAIEDELGDLLFTVVNLTRHSAVDAESALTRASEKFSQRFRQVERQAVAEGLQLTTMEIDQLDALWERAKHSTACD